MTTVTESIANFLQANRDQVNNADMLKRWHVGMETQVNVTAGDGERAEGKGTTYENANGDRWWSIRIPRNAKSKPHFKDYALTWPLDSHVEAIGCTGWDWKARRSRWVGFDFDAITGHAGTGISDCELEDVRRKASELPYVEVRKSTSGTGLHLYVFFGEEGVPTANHTEHAALGRAVLGLMSADAGLDFTASVDACGMVLWIWHSKANAENHGLELIKTADGRLSESKLPINWRDHVDVVTRKRSKVKVKEIPDGSEDEFEVLTAGQSKTPLDDTHKRIIEALTKTGYSTVWNPDHHCLHTHTAGLAQLHDSEKLRGVFQTNSPGSDPHTPNCFMFPLADGAWKVCRFTPGIKEAETWSHDEWTFCYFNRLPDVAMACRAAGGLENAKGYSFETATQARDAATMLSMDLPILPDERPVSAEWDKFRLIFTAHRVGQENVKGWSVNARTLQKFSPLDTPEEKESFDHAARRLISLTNEDAGWMMKTKKQIWMKSPRTTVKDFLIYKHGLKPLAATHAMGAIAEDPWKLVSEPFQPEFLPGRLWNRNGAKLRFNPTTEDRPLNHPHWDMIYDHLGRGLNTAVSVDQ